MIKRIIWQVYDTHNNIVLATVGDLESLKEHLEDVYLWEDDSEWVECFRTWTRVLSLGNKIILRQVDGYFDE